MVTDTPHQPDRPVQADITPGTDLLGLLAAMADVCHGVQNAEPLRRIWTRLR